MEHATLTIIGTIGTIGTLGTIGAFGAFVTSLWFRFNVSILYIESWSFRT
jgi:hypothetical protein